MTTTFDDSCRIYVACLASYNAGIPHGAWIDCAGLDAEEITAEIRKVLKSSPMPNAEEWAIHDFEGWAGLKISEHETADQLAEWAAVLSEDDGPARLAYVDWGCSLGSFDDAFFGEWASEREFAEDYADQCFEIPENIAPYFDYEAFARDLFMGDFFSIDAPGWNVWVFLNR